MLSPGRQSFYGAASGRLTVLHLVCEFVKRANYSFKPTPLRGAA